MTNEEALELLDKLDIVRDILIEEEGLVEAVNKIDEAIMIIESHLDDEAED